VSTLSDSFKKYTLVPHKQKFCARQYKACTKNKKHVKKRLMAPAQYHYIKEDVPTDCHIKTI
jgi:hypothetical protein